MSRSKAAAARRPNGGAGARLARIEAAASPWWAAAPFVAVSCARAALLPIRAVVMAADAVVALAFVALGGAALLWWHGWISDAAVSGFLGKLGERALGIVRASGVL